MSAVVVGSGVVTPLGASLDLTWAALLRGEGAISRITRFDPSGFPGVVAAQVADAPTDAAEAGRTWLQSALEEALVGVDLAGVDPERIGVFSGAEAARPGLDEILAALDGEAPGRERGRALAPFTPARWVAETLGARGPVGTWSTACTSSGQAVGEALLAIDRGEVDVAVAIGVDVLVHPLMTLGFGRLGALAPPGDPVDTSCRPFDLDRSGFTLGEGAGVLVAARSDLATRWGRSMGTLLGYGCTSNAWRITDAPPDGRGAAEAMSAALAYADQTVDDVVLVHAHATGTKQNDVGEARAIRRVLGHQPWVWGSKGALGHLVAACGVVGVALALRALREKTCPATRNLRRPDPECDVRHPLGPVSLGSGTALVNAFGFGGANASILVGP
jgi:3-oxoacyl-[acyl-carrier-protein] synthase II